MTKCIQDWQPSRAALELVKLNGATDEHIAKSVAYLKGDSNLNDIDEVEGYDNWDAFFIMFCIKALA